MIRTERVYLIGSPNSPLVEIGWTDKGSTYTFSRLERDGRQQRAGSQVEPVGISHGNTLVLDNGGRRGLTQTEVAEAIGAKRLAVARWEAGLAQPHRGNRRAYAHLLRRLAVKHPNAAIEEVPDEE
ncbi:helix-turn-helix domain-containing protein [Streptomyces sp. NPDC005146]